MQPKTNMKKATYQEPQIGYPELLLERAILNTSQLETPLNEGLENEGVYWVNEY